ncbi:hemagglutinin/amebocyte aggregation factor-like [Ascaphus truei]|uniref:hemagglutinin/amebocyte aggregation factor-like n=1 Tax=Ascaphus truei TaxID=8439 RepID=UPI003F590453
MLCWPHLNTNHLDLRQRRWVSDFDKDFQFICPKQQSINSVISTHNNYYEDRLWDFTCKPTFSQLGSCYWSNYVNCFDEEFSFTCPFGSVISGMASYHRNYEEDRRWMFFCCTGSQPYTNDCNWTYFVNDFDAYIHWQVPNNYFVVGISSYHDNYTEDRRWRFQYCAKA